MKPSQVLDMQGDLLSRMNDDRFYGVIERSLSLDLGSARTTRATYETARLMADAFKVQVKTAYAYRVTEDMSFLVQHAASVLDDSDEFDRSLAPTGAGIVRFDRALPVLDLRGRTMLAHWMVWGPATVGSTPGLMMTWFNDPGTERDEVSNDPEMQPDEAMARVLGRWLWIGSDVSRNGQSIGPPSVEVGDDVRARVLADDPTVEIVPASNTTRYAHALFLLLGQTVTDTAEEHVDRATGRRAARAGLPGRVTVIRLRRLGSRNDDGSVTEHTMSHRSITRGHWRWQPHGVGRTERTRIWINPYVRGPEGAPFRQTEKVYQLDR